MFSFINNLFGRKSKTFKKSQSRSSQKPSRRGKSTVVLGLEEFESRLLPSSTPLHVSGTQLVDPNNNVVILRGVNISGLESGPNGISGDSSQILRTVDVALNDWHSSLLRLTVYPDYWNGSAGNDATAYQSLVDQIVAKASDKGAYVMLTVWGSDLGGHSDLPQALHNLPDNGTAAFWTDAAKHTMLVDAKGNAVVNGPSYANNPTVMFDLFNEPHDDGSGNIGWSQWRDGGQNFTETYQGQDYTYDSPGMQGLLDAVRGAKANNVVAVEGLGYSADLSGVGAGFGLNDVKGNNNLMYELHLYPTPSGSGGWQSAADGDNLVQQLGNVKAPVYVGEFGTPSGPDDPATAINGIPNQGATQWTKDMLAWLHQHDYSWTAWSMSADTAPVLIQNYDNYAPTPYFGAVVKNDLANSLALDYLMRGVQAAFSEADFVGEINSPYQGVANAASQNADLAYGYAHQALSTQSAADWVTAEQYAAAAQELAAAETFQADPRFINPFAGITFADESAGLALAESAPFYATGEVI
jgi:hypothetical protein